LGTAASTDDRSDIACVISFIQQEIRECLPEEHKIIVDGSHFYDNGFNDAVSDIKEKLKERGLV
jgi:uncharacterized protein (DUF2164 family)